MQDFVILRQDAPLFSLHGLDSQQTLLLSGLGSGLAAFVSNFTSSPPSVIRGRQSVTVLLFPEPGFRFILKVGLLDDILPSDAPLQQFLQRSYDWFHLLRGRMEDIWMHNGISGLKEELDGFYSQFLQTFGSFSLLNSLSGSVPFLLMYSYRRILIDYDFQVISYMPLDPLTFTSILSKCLEIQESCPSLVSHMVFWRHYLVSSSLKESCDTYTLYDYLSHPDTGKLDDGLINQVKDKAQYNSMLTHAKPVIGTKSLSWKKVKSKKDELSSFTGFLAPDIRSDGVKEKYIHLKDGGRHRIVIYQLHNVWTFVMLVKQTSDPTIFPIEFYKNLESLFLSSFSSELSLKMEESLEVTHKLMDTSLDPPIRFFYYNGKSFAFKTSVEHNKGLSMSLSVVQSLEALVNEMVQNPQLDTVYRQAGNDTWFLGKRTQERLLFLIQNKSEITLPQIEEQFQLLSEKHFPKVFY